MTESAQTPSSRGCSYRKRVGPGFPGVAGRVEIEEKSGGLDES